MAENLPGRLVVVSGPSGAGKTTILERVLTDCPVPLVRSVSATTRPPRPGERYGVDYHFLSPDDFQSRRQRGDFLECFEVFGRGCWYGTLWSQITPSLQAGKWVVLNIDVNGARAVMERHPQAITIFVRPSSIEELGRRLVSRGTDSQQAIQRRLQQASEELACAPRYQYQVINDDIDQAVAHICSILTEQWEADRHD
jgi:guanylate kinase